MSKTKELLEQVRDKQASKNDPQHWEAVERMIQQVHEAEQKYYEEFLNEKKELLDRNRR